MTDRGEEEQGQAVRSPPAEFPHATPAKNKPQHSLCTTATFKVPQQSVNGYNGTTLFTLFSSGLVPTVGF